MHDPLESLQKNSRQFRNVLVWKVGLSFIQILKISGVWEIFLLQLALKTSP